MLNRKILEKKLDELENLLSVAKREMEMCPQGTLHKEKRGDRFLYLQCQYENENGRRRRRSIGKDRRLIERLARKMYLEKEIEILRNDIDTVKEMLSAFENGYIEPTAENVINRLPERYRGLQRTLIFGGVPGMQGVPSISDALSAWYNGVNESRYGRGTLEWARAAYEKSGYKSENRVHRTSKGLSVRSKSEALIAEKLYEYGIPFRYEEVLHLGDRSDMSRSDAAGSRGNGRSGVMIPDFVLPNAAGGLYYWEHCGLAGNAEYMKRHRQKIENYEKIGVVPWKNLIVTYDDEYGNINTAIIDSEIRNKLL